MPAVYGAWCTVMSNVDKGLSIRASVLLSFKVKPESLPIVSWSHRIVGNDCLGLEIINMTSSAKAETLSFVLPILGPWANLMWFIDSVVEGLMPNERGEGISTAFTSPSKCTKKVFNPFLVSLDLASS